MMGQRHEAEVEPCPHCDGQGWIVVVASEHHHLCDGVCTSDCPVPVQVQQDCPCSRLLEGKGRP